MINFLFGEQVLKFYVFRKKTSVDDIGRFKESKEKPIGFILGTMSSASQKEQQQWSQNAHPITHKIVMRGRANVKAEDIVVHNKQKYYVQGMTNPSKVGLFTNIFVEHREGA